ncbi:MAG: hypothetical protein FJ148_08740 [Deltaproteobacteria bacterium]|nr:hypothetical protein [Deltaproteobacteria bacterium]
MDVRCRIDTVGRRLLGIACAVVLGAVATAGRADALYLDEDQNFSLRLRAYSQLSVAMQDSQKFVTSPEKFTGQMMRNRTFANPELDAKFTSFLPSGWLDDLSGRLALWGFYDGLYDYGPDQYAQAAADIKFNRGPNGAFQTKGDTREQALAGNALRRNVRDIYGHRYRVNEAYVNISKGPVFFRIGRQAISWGEADTIGLLDANNPFDTTIVPGVFLDLDESRIPLWTIRGTYELFSDIGPFSSGLLDTYIVPGQVDTTISPLQMQSASPYSAPPPAPGPGVEVFQRRPGMRFGNSRWGVRFQTVIARDYTTSVWFYKTFPTEPVAINLGVSADTGRLVTSVEAPLINVAGVASTFFSSFLNSIVRAEVEVFNNTPGFRVDTNITAGLSAACNAPGAVKNSKTCGHYDEINLIRGELGVDRNVFIPWLNESNSFIWVTSFVFTANPDETATKDYRASGILKPSALIRAGKGGAPAGSITTGCNGQPGPCDFVNQGAFDFFFQTHLESNWLHGKVPAGITAVMNNRGALAIFPDIAFRMSDSFIFSARYVNIHTFGSENNGFSAGLGLFRDRDEVWLRATYQLN